MRASSQPPSPRQRSRFTFREQLYAIGVLVRGIEFEQKQGDKVASDLKRLQRESRKDDFVPYVFWAVYPAPLPAVPEAGFGALRPRLERYFDEHIVVNRSPRPARITRRGDSSSARGLRCRRSSRWRL